MQQFVIGYSGQPFQVLPSHLFSAFWLRIKCQVPPFLLFTKIDISRSICWPNRCSLIVQAIVVMALLVMVTALSYCQCVIDSEIVSLKQPKLTLSSHQCSYSLWVEVANRGSVNLEGQLHQSV